MSNSKSARWDQQGGDAEKLVNLFKLYKKTKGAAGVDPNLTKPSQIKELVFDKLDYLSKYNRERFPDNFKSLGQDFQLNEDITTGRKGE